MTTNIRTAPVTPQLERAHALNHGGFETADRTEPLHVACGTFRPLDAKAARVEMRKQSKAKIDGAALILFGVAVVIFAVGFLGGVWACKAGGW